MDNKRNCGPAFTPRLAEAYVPFQCWEQPLTPTEGLAKGTVFPSLVIAGYSQLKGGV
jgi:hypothetical protein